MSSPYQLALRGRLVIVGREPARRGPRCDLSAGAEATGRPVSYSDLLVQRSNHVSFQADLLDVVFVEK